MHLHWHRAEISEGGHVIPVGPKGDVFATACRARLPEYPALCLIRKVATSCSQPDLASRATESSCSKVTSASFSVSAPTMFDQSIFSAANSAILFATHLLLDSAIGRAHRALPRKQNDELGPTLFPLYSSASWARVNGADSRPGSEPWELPPSSLRGFTRQCAVFKQILGWHRDRGRAGLQGMRQSSALPQETGNFGSVGIDCQERMARTQGQSGIVAVLAVWRRIGHGSCITHRHGRLPGAIGAMSAGRAH